MLTRIKSFGDVNRYCGLSTDTKPIEDVPNMSEFSEIDTSKKYVFDEENGQWVEDTGSGGGGGGGSGKQDTITVVGLAKFDGNGGFSDVDYQTPSSSPIKVLINENGEIKWIDLDRLFNVNYLCFEAAEANSTIQLTPYVDDVESDIPELSLEYSTDKVRWMNFIPGTTIITLSDIGDKVYLRGDNETFCHYVEEESWADNGYWFEMSGKIKASGSLMSIFDKYDFSRKISVPFACSTLFIDCDSLITAPELPATTLSRGCYDSMFSGCTSLVAAPELPAATLAEWCYSNMFEGCTALQNVKVSFTAFTPSNATSNWITANKADSTFTCPESLVILGRSSNTVPSNWTIVRI